MFNTINVNQNRKNKNKEGVINQNPITVQYNILHTQPTEQKLIQFPVDRFSKTFSHRETRLHLGPTALAPPHTRLLNWCLVFSGDQLRDWSAAGAGSLHSPQCHASVQWQCFNWYIIATDVNPHTMAMTWPQCTSPVIPAARTTEHTSTEMPYGLNMFTWSFTEIKRLHVHKICKLTGHSLARFANTMLTFTELNNISNRI